MVIKTIYHGVNQVIKIYRGGKIIYQRDSVTFHTIEDGKLIIDGALSAISAVDGLYLDCEPNWTFPELENGVLTIQQAYSATQNGTTLEVR